MKPMTGGCLCGRVRYTIDADPVRSGICHCQCCQRYTGSAFQPFMIFPRTAVRLEGTLTPSVRVQIAVEWSIGGSARAAVPA